MMDTGDVLRAFGAQSSAVIFSQIETAGGMDWVRAAICFICRRRPSFEPDEGKLGSSVSVGQRPRWLPHSLTYRLKLPGWNSSPAAFLYADTFDGYFLEKVK